MREASKTQRVREADYAARFLAGSVLDIGAGPDPVCPHAVVFDQEHGDANFIDRHFPAASFDTVHSSHCLEHMIDPVAALERWWSLVKPGGHMILVVPHEDLYEQGIWPSFFNDDHKTSFRIDKAQGLSPASYDAVAICQALPGAQLVLARVQDQGLDRSLLLPAGVTPRRLRHPLKLAWSLVRRLSPPGSPLHQRFLRMLVRRGHPFDQTSGEALAQIEVVVRKG